MASSLVNSLLKTHNKAFVEGTEENHHSSSVDNNGATENSRSYKKSRSNQKSDFTRFLNKKVQCFTLFAVLIIMVLNIIKIVFDKAQPNFVNYLLNKTLEVMNKDQV